MDSKNLNNEFEKLISDNLKVDNKLYKQQRNSAKTRILTKLTQSKSLPQPFFWGSFGFLIVAAAMFILVLVVVPAPDINTANQMANIETSLTADLKELDQDADFMQDMEKDLDTLVSDSI